MEQCLRFADWILDIMHIEYVFNLFCKFVHKTYDYVFSNWESKDVVTSIVAVAALIVSIVTFRESKFQRAVASNQYKLSLFQIRKEAYNAITDVIPDINLVRVDYKTIIISGNVEKKLSPYQYIFDASDPENPIGKFKEKLHSIRRTLYKPKYFEITKFLSENKSLTIDDIDNIAMRTEVEEMKELIVELNLLLINVVLYIKNQLELPSDPTSKYTKTS